MDNEGGQAPPIVDPAAEGAGVGEENVDQYFDDGGETFLPADHVSTTYTGKAPLANFGRQ